MTRLLEAIKEEYNLCINHPSEYQSQVNSISDLFILKGEDRFRADYCPVRVVGKYNDAPFIMFGLNPGIDARLSPLEDEEARKSWEHYTRLYFNFFEFPQFWIKSPYYVAIGHLVSGLTNDESTPKPKLLDNYLCNMELIPYHSSSLSFPSILSTTQLKYLMDSFNNSLDFITASKKVKLFLLNGSIWNTLLIKNGVIKDFKRTQILKGFNMYFFRIRGVQSVIFDKFFTLHYYGMTHHHRKVTIPKIIRENVIL